MNSNLAIVTNKRLYELKILRLSTTSSCADELSSLGSQTESCKLLREGLLLAVGAYEAEVL